MVEEFHWCGGRWRGKGKGRNAEVGDGRRLVVGRQYSSKGSALVQLHRYAPTLFCSVNDTGGSVRMTCRKICR